MSHKQTSNLIFWNVNQFLEWVNFKGEPNYQKEEETAESGVGFEPDYSIDYDDGTREFSFVEFNFKAYFDPQRSWVKKEKITPELRMRVLKHEQGHFDITEKFTRKLNQKLREDSDSKIFLIKGKTLNERKKRADKEDGEYVTKILLDITKEWQDYQEDYETKTDGGREFEIQECYDLEFEKLRN